MPTAKNQRGFTLVELLIVLVILSVLLALTTVNLARPQTTSSLDGAVNTLVADIKSQQMLAMSGDQGSTTSQQPQGLYLQPSSYTLFAGSTYSAGDTNNFVINTGQGITLATTFPSTGLIFNKGTGDVNGFVNGSNTITLSFNGTSKVVTVSRFGAVTVN